MRTCLRANTLVVIVYRRERVLLDHQRNLRGKIATFDGDTGGNAVGRRIDPVVDREFILQS